MKTIISILALIVLSFPVIADEKHDACSVVAKHAENIMSARQGGVAADKIYSIYQELEEDSSNYENSMALARLMIMGAYDEPKFITDAYVERAITEFRNKAYIECLQAIEG